jgi:CRP/FNR family transcriptional regulator, cyclic AMP receptor protein
MAVSSPDLKAFLLATPFFGGLSDASLDLLVSMLVERRFDAGATPGHTALLCLTSYNAVPV